MPNLDFYAFEDDQRAVVAAVFDLGLFRVFEWYSARDRELREFRGAKEVPEDATRPCLTSLALYAAKSGPEPTRRRIDLQPGALGDATFRYSCEGWGVIHLQFGDLHGSELRWSNTSHTTEKRATQWFAYSPELGDPVRWDWASVARASGKLNRLIRAMAVRKIGAHPVLPQAARLIDEIGLRYEYGVGIHATHMPSLSRRREAGP